MNIKYEFFIEDVTYYLGFFLIFVGGIAKIYELTGKYWILSGEQINIILISGLVIFLVNRTLVLRFSRSLRKLTNNRLNEEIDRLEKRVSELEKQKQQKETKN